MTNLMDSLQQRAEAALGQRTTRSPEQFAALSPGAAQRVLHNLQVNQVELEMQNEELRRAHAALDSSRAHYVDFYDLAPVGYCTVSAKGLIKEVNLATSTLLNVPRSQLINRPISRFIFNDDQSIYYDFRHKLADTDKSLSCELRLIKREGAPLWAHLVATSVQDDDNGSELRIVLKDITERKNIEANLSASEERYRSLAEWTPEPIVVHGAGKTLYVNPAAIKMFGATSASDLVGKPTLDLIHPDFRKTVAERLKVNAEAGGGTPMLEQKLLKLDGSVIDVEVQGVQVYFNGKPAIQAAMRDVTQRNKAEAERKRHEQALEDSQRRLTRAEEIAHVGNWSYEVADGVVQWSDELWNIFGRDPHSVELTYDTFTSWIREDFRAYHDNCMRRMLELRPGETIKDFVYCLVRPDGEQRWTETFMEAEFDPEGSPMRFFGVAKDITEQRVARATLQLTANVFNHAREGVTITDADGSIIDVNAAFTRITGYSREEVLGQNPRILQSGRQTKEFYVALWRDLLASDHWSGEIWNKRKNGEIYPELLNISAVKDAQGNVGQYVGLFTDITVRRQMEDKVHQMAFFDPLTRLPNRRTLSDRLGQTMASSKRSGRYGALMVLDLDNFKPLNDAHGHAAGDLLLEAVAGRMMACVREVDTVARIGGDEFVVLLSELDTDRSESMAQAGLIAEKIRLALAAPYSLPLTRQGQEASAVEHRCTASIGVVLFLNHEASQEDILRWADAAMYQAKAAGRNAIRFYGADGIT